MSYGSRVLSYIQHFEDASTSAYEYIAYPRERHATDTREMRSYTNENPIRFCRNNPILIMTAYFQSSSRLTFVWRKHSVFVIILSLFLVIDLLLWSANSFEFVEGAWIATLISFIIFFIGFYWHYGKKKI